MASNLSLSDSDKERTMDFRTVELFVQRHGPRKGDTLTPEGVEVVHASKVSGPLSGMAIHSFFTSPYDRTTQTARIIAGDPILVEMVPGLAPLMPEPVALRIWGAADAKLKERQVANPTVGDWLEALGKDGEDMRRQLQLLYAQIAVQVALDHPEPDIARGYCASHGTFCELALPDSALRIPPLEPAQVLRFVYHVRGMAATLETANFLPPPIF